MIGRKEETKRFKKLLRHDKSDFIAVTGRRRIGKTYLIDQLLCDHYCFNITGIQDSDMDKQLKNFGQKLSEYTAIKTYNFENWQDAFIGLKTYLKSLPKTQKQVIFIDELPWIATARSGFLQILAHLWNDFLSKEKHFILVICGSATSWISAKVVNDKGGLHNRLTEIIHLQPFTLAETKQFLEAKHITLTENEICKYYMSLGGVPYYLEQIRKGESFASNIEKACFSNQGRLKNEYNNLYKALFNNADIHEKIVSYLASHPQGKNKLDIAEGIKLKSTTGSYSRAMQELIESQFITEINEIGKKKRNSIYRLIDEYSLFYHKFIVHHKKYTQGIWQQLSQSQSYKIWTGYAFESVCIKHVDQIKKALGISGIYSTVHSMAAKKTATTPGFQIDLILDRKDDTINLFEIKFYAAPYSLSKEYYQKLLLRKQAFIDYTKTRKTVFQYFITNHPIHENAYSNELVDRNISLEDLF